MKKVIALVLALVFCFALACPALAVGEDSFVPSIGYKPTPDFGGVENADGELVIGHVHDSEGEVLAEVCIANGKIYVNGVHGGSPVGEHHECLVITPISEAKTSTKIPEAARILLLQVYEQLKENGMKLMSEVEGLDEIVAKALGEGMSADDLVVKELFDVSVICKALEEWLAPEGTTLCLDFDFGLTKGDFVQVVIYKDDEWQLIENVKFKDDKIVCTLYEDFCPVAVLVPAEFENIDVPATNGADSHSALLWSGIAVVALAGIAVLATMLRKRGNER